MYGYQCAEIRVQKVKSKVGKNFFNYSLVFLMIFKVSVLQQNLNIKVNYHYYDSYPFDSQNIKDPCQ